MPQIHQSAIIDSHAQIHETVVVGPYCVIEGDVVIDEGTSIGPHVHLANGCRIGKACKIFTGAVLGTIPQDLKFKEESTLLSVGDRTTIREYATLNRGTVESGKTVVGSDCLLMAYSHVAHDCRVGNHCILANAVNLAGHVVIEDWASLGGMVPVHQFTRIGQHAFIGGNYRAVQDVPPYILAAGEPLRFSGLNSVGLRRRGFSTKVVREIKKTYRLIYQSDLNVSQAIERVQADLESISEVEYIVNFIKSSKRGIIG